MSAEAQRDQGAPQILRFFEFKHLPKHLQDFSSPFCELALELTRTLPDCEERDFALRKLLEAKDCAVRAKLLAPQEPVK